MKTQWNDKEEEALSYLPHRAQVCYLRGLRRYMDYKTGIVGAARHISYQSLSEVTEVIPDRGSKEGHYRATRQGVRSMLKMLERAGLIQPVLRQGEVMCLVFKLPLADTVLVCPQEEQPMNIPPRTTATTTQEKTPEGTDNNGFYHDFLRGEKPDEQPRNNRDEQHTSGNQVNNTPLLSVSEWITEDWWPSEMIVAYCRQMRCVSDQIFNLVVMDYKAYWLSDDGRARGQSQSWDVHFKKSYHAILAKVEKHCHRLSASESQTKNRTVNQQLTDTSWAL